MPTQAGITTADELERMPADGWRYELVRGELRQAVPAGWEHGDITMRIAWRMAQYVEQHRLGKVLAAETGFRIGTDPDTVRAPDVAFVAQPRLDALGKFQGFWPGAPDLAVEVVSPNDRYTAVEEKVVDWLTTGARMVLLVNPRRQSVTAYRSPTVIMVLTAEDTLSGGDVVPGWEVRVGDLFA